MSKMLKYDWVAGITFGKVMLTGKSYIDGAGKRKVEVICECGRTEWMNWQNMKSGQTKSCGCFKRTQLGLNSITHGLSKHPLYIVWGKLRDRCLNHNDPRYPLYGGSGVVISEEWNDFKVFYDWAINNGYQKGLEIDKDKLSPFKFGRMYSPDFCCFISHKENCNYKRNSRKVTYNGELKSITDWCKELGLERRTTSRRIFNQGWSVEEAFKLKKKINDYSI